jgi:hypothetical protein
MGWRVLRDGRATSCDGERGTCLGWGMSTIRWAMRGLGLGVAVACACFGLAACDDGDRPVDIPFTGKEVRAGAPKKKKKRPAPVSSAPTAKPVPKAVKVGPVMGCCNALAFAARTAKQDGDKANFKVAASVCYRLDKEVREGKRTKAQALSSVRGSLLQGAPAACR